MPVSLLNRRRFLATSALATAPSILPARLLGENAPSKQITLGLIGMGLQGMSRNFANFLSQKDAKVLAVCDVMMPRAEAAKNPIFKREAREWEKAQGACKISAAFALLN